MRIGDRNIDASSPPYVIAEIGVNHDGCVDRARSLTDAAANAGADAVKFQMFEAERLLSSASRLAAYQEQAGADDPVALLKNLELTCDELKDCVDHAHGCGLHAIVTVFSTDLVDAAESLSWDAWKTASPDIIHRPLIERLMRTNRPLLLSTGAATAEEISETISWLGVHEYLLLHCVSAYPTPDDDAALGAIRAMQKLTPRAQGYSDHTQSIDTGALAVATGARLLEKHLTYDRKATGPDHAASLEPDAFKNYVDAAHRAFRMLGDGTKRPLPIEHDVRSVSRQSIVTLRDLPAGHVLAETDVAIKRPGGGVSPALLHAIIGKPLRSAAKADTPLLPEQIL